MSVFLRRLAAVLLGLAASVAAANAACPVAGQPDGQRAALVQGIQRQLAEHGFEPESFDGTYGPNTARAIRSYQVAARLKADGCPTQALLDHLSFSEPKVMAPSARHGSLVSGVQQELSRLGYYTGRTDGVLGAKTRAAIQAFQLDNGLAPTGDADSPLLGRLRTTITPKR